ncbi:MAG TPA: helix-turn-helix domain-containing protein [Verrucomicrobiae bacterium]|nr:helix-turn-helix domain-containing protein [Verrucomicrobiae bacterium]
MNKNGQMIEKLAGSEIFREYERAYTEATGMPVTFRPLETWRLPLHGKRNENRFCALMAERSRTCAACLQMQESLARSAMDEPCSMTCAYGLVETAVPVKLGGETIGFLQTGQVMRQKPTQAAFDKAVSELQKLGVEVDHERARETFFATPVVSAKKLESISKLLFIFADHLSMKSNQIAVQAANAEPPIITRAKTFIEEHYTEDLSLGQVAKAVHTSVFYFCKLFKKSLGLNFTEYVSRVRTEKAKNLLLNPNLRVSEIAYEVGFQSLTHFNRVFKKVTGESPSSYRGRLPKTS